MTARHVREFEETVTRLIPSIAYRTDDELDRLADGYVRLAQHVIFERVYRNTA